MKRQTFALLSVQEYKSVIGRVCFMLDTDDMFHLRYS